MDPLNPASQYTASPQNAPPDTSAAVQNMRAALGIVHDSIEMSLAQLSPYVSSGAIMGYQSYRATAENPVLDHTLSQVFGPLTSQTGKINEAWEKIYEALKNELPEEVLAMLIADQALPFDARNPALVGLDNALTVGAQYLSSLDATANLGEISSVVASRTALNGALPLIASQGILTTSAAATILINNILTEKSANYQNYDYFTNILANMQHPLALLASVNRSFDKIVDGALPQSAQDKAAKAAEEFGAILKQMDNVHAANDDLSILRGMVQSLENVCLALSLPTTQAGALFFSSQMASIGLNTNESKAGVIGPTLGQMGDVAGALASAAMPSSPASVNILLMNTVTLMNTLAIAVASQAVQPNPGESSQRSDKSYGLLSLGFLLDEATNGDPVTALVVASLALFLGITAHSLCPTFGNYPARDPSEIPAAHFFSFEVLLRGIIGAGVINAFWESFISSVSRNDAGAKMLAPIYSLMTLTLVILSAVSYGRQPPEALLDQYYPTIREGLANLKILIEKDGSNATGASAAAVAIDEAQHALDINDTSRLLGALKSLLDLTGTSFENLTKEINVVRGAANIITGHLQEKSSDPTLGVMTVA